ncbi:hypothetical protein HG702_09320 [Pectobacterium versatile]|nr:hypothetical protein HG702_09320 [Pectobacterium versatile]
MRKLWMSKKERKPLGFYLSINRLKINEKGYFKYWFLLWNFFVSVVYETIKNPKFIFSFLVIMIISSAGIWAPWLYGIDLSSVCNTTVPSDAAIKIVSGEVIHSEKIIDSFSIVCSFTSYQEITLIQNFSLFMFNLGLLGGIAAEFFIQKKSNNECKDSIEKNEATNYEENDDRIKEYGAFFLWIIAFILSFFALTNPTGASPEVILGCFLSIMLWVFTNLRKKEYKVNDVDPNSIVGGKDVALDKLPGIGLSDNVNFLDNSALNLNGEGLE